MGGYQEGCLIIIAFYSFIAFFMGSTPCSTSNSTIKLIDRNIGET
jgi:hypothetical protein